MPLRVHCPNGCLIRLPASRAGKIVRCSECKSTIQLAEISASERQSGKPIPIHARLVSSNDDSLVDSNDGTGDERTDPVIFDAHPEPDSEPVSVTVRDVDVASVKLDLEPKGDVPVFGPIELNGPADSGEKQDSPPAEPATSPTQRGDSAVDFSSIDVPAPASLAQLADEIDVPQVDKQLKTDADVGNFRLQNLTEDDENLVAQQKKDHKTLARFYGFCIATLGLISLVPAIIFLVKINQADMTAITPRWIYLLIFIGSIHVVYAVYLIQIADWSALWAVSILMLFATCFYGIFSTAILLDDGFGPVVSFLQLTVSQMRPATIWCLIGLCFSVLTSYLCGREALNWRKNEKRLFEIALQRLQMDSSKRSGNVERTAFN